MKKKLIILDFDHTVFNTTKYIDFLVERFEKDFGISRDEFLHVRNNIKDCCVVVDMDEFVVQLPHENKVAMLRAHHEVIAEHAHECIFADVRSFMQKHFDTHDILFLTHGNKKLQTEKIQHSKLPVGYEILISVEPKDYAIASYVKKYQQVYFIDDKAHNIDMVKTAFPKIVTYKIERPEDKPYAGQQTECACVDHIIQDLNIIID